MEILLRPGLRSTFWAPETLAFVSDGVAVIVKDVMSFVRFTVYSVTFLSKEGVKEPWSIFRDERLLSFDLFTVGVVGLEVEEEPDEIETVITLGPGLYMFASGVRISCNRCGRDGDYPTSSCRDRDSLIVLFDPYTARR